MFDVRILADSESPTGVRLTTLQATFPRFILAEVNTHRILSRNSASSRAIPFKKQVEMIEADPFVPEKFPVEQKGMSGGEPIGGITAEMAEDEWMRAMEDAIRHATRLHERRVHKSLVNRLLEPFMWHTAIISATNWSNFFALRTDPEAQPEFRTIAIMMETALEINEPKQIEFGEWHLPLVQEWERKVHTLDDVIYMSAGRCARVSYLTHDGLRDPDKDIQLAERLISNGHMSPTEHQAECSHFYKQSNFDLPFLQFRKTITNEHDFSLIKKSGAAA